MCDFIWQELRLHLNPTEINSKVTSNFNDTRLLPRTIGNDHNLRLNDLGSVCRANAEWNSKVPLLLPSVVSHLLLHYLCDLVGKLFFDVALW